MADWLMTACIVALSSLALAYFVLCLFTFTVNDAEHPKRRGNENPKGGDLRRFFKDLFTPTPVSIMPLFHQAARFECRRIGRMSPRLVARLATLFRSSLGRCSMRVIGTDERILLMLLKATSKISNRAPPLRRPLQLA